MMLYPGCEKEYRLIWLAEKRRRRARRFLALAIACYAGVAILCVAAYFL